MGKQGSKKTILSKDELERHKMSAVEYLAEATEPEEILKWCAVCLWFDSGNKTKCPEKAIPTCGQIVEWLPSAPDSAGKTLVDFIHFFQVLYLLFEREQGEQLAPLMMLERFSHFMDFASLKNDIDEDSAVKIFEKLHTAWLPLYNTTGEEKAAVEDARKIFFNIPFPPIHPLRSLVDAWQKDMTAVQMTREVDRSFPVALRIPFGAVSAEEIEAEKDYHLPVFEPFESSQMTLHLGDRRKNELARHLPIRSWLADWNTPGAKPRGGRGGAVPLWLRLFLEALVCSDRFHHKRVVFYELEYLYRLMYGNVRWDIVRVRDLRKMIDVASRAAVVLRGGGEEHPVNFKYFEGLKRDSKVFVEVAAVRDTNSGALTGIEDLRDAYRSSNATLQAYLSATEYLDRVWTYNNRLLYDTIPEINDDGVILNHLGEPMTRKTTKTDKETGKKIEVEKPIKSLKGADKELLSQVKRIPNPKFTPDPIDADELVGVCWADKSIPKSQRRSYKKRALDTWEGLRIIDLEKGQDLEEYQDLENVQDLVIIRPSQYHRNTYRAIKKASEQAKNQ